MPQGEPNTTSCPVDFEIHYPRNIDLSFIWPVAFLSQFYFFIFCFAFSLKVQFTVQLDKSHSLPAYFFVPRFHCFLVCQPHE